MAPIRTKGKEPLNDGKRPQFHKKPQKDSDTLPGVQKIKASLRQTRRLLAKDKLAADVRVATERRLKALEADLHRAELARKERSLAIRYHKVKFFERQKVVRKINQTKKRLASAGGDKGVLETRLFDLRVDLNYILVREPYHLQREADRISTIPKRRSIYLCFPLRLERASLGNLALRQRKRMCVGTSYVPGSRRK
ncbi:hypothetical protein AX14_013748 [Amanita brunnescens Koide BX004]|nr:hypothetical protein AX14_013748 [Amanita brunnescens Koide BX004]